jgi:hypothetical protein
MTLTMNQVPDARGGFDLSRSPPSPVKQFGSELYQTVYRRGSNHEIVLECF